MRDTLRSFVLDNFMFGAAPEELDEDASFLDSGIIDSTGVMELVGFLEDRFGVAVEDAELTPENLDSINRLCAYLKGKGIEPDGEWQVRRAG
ncbi:MAG: acyl carrier protein [Planctomycetota bacterium]|jgi:acyl carrier protein